LLRLNPDGSRDASFNPPNTLRGDLWRMAIQGDGKIVVVGNFIDMVGRPTTPLMRLNADGSVDTDFHPPEEWDASICGLALQHDGKILVSGDFSRGLARLYPDGRLDDGFTPNTGFNRTACFLGLQSTNKLIVGGQFDSVADVIRDGIARINLVEVGPPPTPFSPLILNPRHTGDDFIFSLPTLTGKTYQANFKTEISEEAWLSGSGMAVKGNGMVISVTNKMSGAPRIFYRLQVAEEE